MTFFVDGGVLDNFPFKHAVRAIAGKPASTQVDRRLLFIEPDPAAPGQPPNGSTPGFRSTIWAGLSKLPRRQPIGDALDELMQYNRRVLRVKQMISAVEDDVIVSVEPLLELSYDEANHAANTGAIGSSGFSFQAYLALKLLSVVEGIATSVSGVLNYPPTSTQALFVRRALLAWADDAKLLSTDGGLSDDQKSFLRTFDLGYGHRRLAFVIGRLGHYYDEGADRELLNTLKHRLYELVSELQVVLDRPDAAFLHDSVDRIFGVQRLHPHLARWQVNEFLEGAKVEIEALRVALGTYLDKALEGFGERAYGEVERLTAELPAEIRFDLRLRYLGFPYWDATTYPVRMLSDVAELDEVKVVRVSPLDTHLLTNGNAAHASAKLHGVSLGHFGAFFKRSWRENDYLWGRLDGAERLLWLIGETDDVAAKEAFAAIVAEEEPKLRKAAGLIRRVREYVGGGPVAAPHAADHGLTPT